MLSCELCCSFRAVRLLCLILLQQSSLKKTLFFLKCSVVWGSGFIFGCLLRCPAQLEGRLATVCLPRLHPAVVWFVLLVEALLFCCGLRHTLWQSLSVVAGCLGNGRLCQQWACISVGTGCLGNGWLCQQWACISVGVGCLGNSGRPPPQRVSDRLHGDLLKSRFCLPHWAAPDALSLQSPGRAQCPSLTQSHVQPSQVSGCRFNRAPEQARPVGSAV